MLIIKANKVENISKILVRASKFLKRDIFLLFILSPLKQLIKIIFISIWFKIENKYKILLIIILRYLLIYNIIVDVA